MAETSTGTATVQEVDRKVHMHPFTSAAEHADGVPRLMVEGAGIHVRDNGGKQYLDAMAGLWCVNVGYGRDEIVDAVSDQARRLPYYHTFLSMTNEPAARLAVLVSYREPSGMLERAEAVAAEAVNPFLSLATSDFVAQAHARGLAVYPYTADEVEWLEKLLAAGVDGIFTNMPDRLRAMVPRR